MLVAFTAVEYGIGVPELVAEMKLDDGLVYVAFTVDDRY